MKWYEREKVTFEFLLPKTNLRPEFQKAQAQETSLFLENVLRIT